MQENQKQTTELKYNLPECTEWTENKNFYYFVTSSVFTNNTLTYNTLFCGNCVVSRHTHSVYNLKSAMFVLEKIWQFMSGQWSLINCMYSISN